MRVVLGTGKIRQDLHRKIEELSGQEVSLCYQCGKCSAGCPVAYTMDYLPNQIIRLIQLGMEKRALASSAIWMCVSCQTCSVRCPRGIDLARIMDSLRIIAKRKDAVPKKQLPPLFDRLFLRSIEKHSRLNEMGLIAGMNIASRRPFKDILMLPTMLRKGKIKFRPNKTRSRHYVRDIIRKISLKEPGGPWDQPMRIDLFRKFPFLKRLVKMRSFQLAVVLPNLALFSLFLVAGIFGNPMGNQNIMIVFVWIFWWSALIIVMVPLAGRIWCTVCPFPSAGEWMQRRTFSKVKSGKPFGLNKRWPKKLNNIWLQNIGFLSIALFSALLVTRPIVSVAVLGGIIAASVPIMLIYRKRAFCMYLCPVSGFLGLYAMFSSLELRVKNREVCLKHKEKECLRGSKDGYGCPWFQYPGKMDRNNYCGLCMECVKTCPKDNIALNLRPPASDTRMKGYDEAWKSFIMLTLSIVYSVTLLGPWGFLKDWANPTWTGQWGGFGIYASAVVLACLVVIPGIYGMFAGLAKFVAGAKEVDFKTVFIRFSYIMVPMGLLAWIAFSLSLIMINGSYVISVISDPFGWGWNLFGTADFPWTPFYPRLLPYLQVVTLLIGLVFSVWKGYEIAKKIFEVKEMALRAMVPMTAFIVIITGSLMWLFVG